MPRQLGSFTEMQKAVALQLEGYTFLDIAKILTRENLQEYVQAQLIDIETFNKLISINDKRTFRTGIKVVFDDMIEHLPSDIDTRRFKDSLVAPGRLKIHSKNPLWKNYKEAYADEFVKLKAKQATTLLHKGDPDVNITAE